MAYPFDTLAGLEALGAAPDADDQAPAPVYPFDDAGDAGAPNPVEAVAYVELQKDYREQQRTSAGGAGRAFTFDIVPLPFYWFIERIFVRSSGTATAWYAFVLDAADNAGTNADRFSTAMDYTAQAIDISDENHPIVVRANQQLALRVEGTTANDLLSARIQFSVRQAVQVSFPQRITVEEAMRINAVLPGLITVGGD